MPREYDAIVVDLDGTLLDRQGHLPEANRDALRAAAAAGVRVMVATGRSKIATLPVLEQLGIDSLAVMFNGAAVWDPGRGRMIEERTLSERTLERVLAYGETHDDLTLVMLADEKYVLHPRSERETQALRGLHGLQPVTRAELRREYTIRVTFIGERHGDSADYERELLSHVDLPVYLTHFPLSILPGHETSAMHAVDVHPPCRGKAESLRVLQDHYGIAAERVVAVGDAPNDEPLLSRAGLGVAMGNAVPSTRAVARRVIGHHDGPAVAELVRELFL